MSVRVKICGLRSSEALDAALAAGADYVGLIFYPRSPRNVDLATAAALATRARGKATVVALLVDPTDAQVDDVVERVAPDMLQLHGKETPERVAEIRNRTGRKIMKALAVETAEDASRALAYRDVADLILFDAKAPKSLTNALPGGNGVPFDWRALAEVKDQVPYMLSGGLNPENVAAAIAVTGATAVDVSSGVERAPGEKDPDLIRRFINAAKATGGAPAASPITATV